MIEPLIINDMDDDIVTLEEKLGFGSPAVCLAVTQDRERSAVVLNQVQAQELAERLTEFVKSAESTQGV